MIQLVDIGFIPRSTIRMDHTTTTSTTTKNYVAGAARSSSSKNVRTTKDDDDDDDDDDDTTTRFFITSTVHGCGGSGGGINTSGMGDSNRWKTPTSARNLLKLNDELVVTNLQTSERT
jgi:hypothetical protein